MKKEFRFLPSEVKADEGEKTPILAGYSAVFNESINMYGVFTESIAPNAFAKVLADEQDTVALFNHDANFPLARVSNGTLILSQDDKGLYAVIEPNMSATRSKDIYELVKRGDVIGQSFAFTVRREEWDIPEDDEERLPHRTISEIGMLYDVGPVTYPAYPQTDISARTKEARSLLDAELERRLEDTEEQPFTRSISLLKRKLQLASQG